MLAPCPPLSRRSCLVWLGPRGARHAVTPQRPSKGPSRMRLSPAVVATPPLFLYARAWLAPCCRRPPQPLRYQTCLAFCTGREPAWPRGDARFPPLRGPEERRTPAIPLQNGRRRVHREARLWVGARRVAAALGRQQPPPLCTVSHAPDVPSVPARPVASDVLCCAIAPDGANVAMGCTNGEIIIHQASSPFAKVAVLRPEASSVTEPVTCIRYLPAASGDKASNMMLAACECSGGGCSWRQRVFASPLVAIPSLSVHTPDGSGCVRRWHVTSGQCVHEQQGTSGHPLTSFRTPSSGMLVRAGALLGRASAARSPFAGGLRLC